MKNVVKILRKLFKKGGLPVSFFPSGKKISSPGKSGELEYITAAGRDVSNFTLTYLFPYSRDWSWHLHTTE
jgi:hypothetical protein